MIVMFVPFSKLSIWHLDQLVAPRSIVQSNDFLSYGVSSEVGEKMNPNPVVECTGNKAIFISAMIQNATGRKYLRADGHNDVGAIPKTDVASSGTARGRIPRHNQEVKIL